jgi:uncharacterized protein
MNSVYHDGERYIQEQMGVRDKSDSLSSMIYHEMPVVAAQFLESLNFAVVTFSTSNQELFSSVLFDINSFITILHTKEIVINLEKSSFIPDNILGEKNLNIGLLGLEFENRMRIRVNGKGKIEDNKLFLVIDEVYSNCPKYINDRKIVGKVDFFNDSILDKYTTLVNECKKIIENSDTFFIATNHENKGSDISHKGGKKGFLKIISPTQLEFDDFPGNNMYNTLGNIYTNPNISILIVDFASNDILHINGHAKIIENIEKGRKKLKIVIECTDISIESNKFVLKYNK